MTGEPKISTMNAAGLMDPSQLQQVLSNLVPGILVFCRVKTFDIEFANKAFFNFVGGSYTKLGDALGTENLQAISQAVLMMKGEPSVQLTLRARAQVMDLHITLFGADLVIIQGTVEDKSRWENHKLVEELSSYKQMVQEKEEFLGQGSFELNLVTGVEGISTGLLSIFGRESTGTSPTIYDLLRHYFDPAEQCRILEFFKDISETGDGREIEVNIVVNGRQKALEIFAKVYRNDGGKTERIVGTVKDITAIRAVYNELLQFKKELTERELLLKHGTWEFNVGSREFNYSAGLFEVFGVGSDKEDSSFRMDNFCMPGEQQKADRIMEDVLEYDTAYLDDLMVRTSKGDIKYVEVFARLVRNSGGEPERIIGISRDISRVHSFKMALKDQLIQVDRMNQQLTEAKEKLEIQLAALEKANHELQLYKQTMLDKDEFLNQGTWEWDIRSNDITYSRGIYRLFGYHHKDEMKEWDESGKDMFRHLNEEERNRSYEDWENILEEADTYLREMEIVSKDGFQRRLETFGKVFREDNGKAYKVIGTTRDITKLKEYEQDLEIKIDELNRSNRDLEEFAYIASHDLLEPLRKLTIFGQRLSSSAEDELSPTNRDYLGRMLKASENMRNLIDNLLEFSRVTRGAATFVKTDLNQLVEEVIFEQELKIEETGATVSAEKMPVLEVVPSQLKQVFNNLLNNALKFIQPTVKPSIAFECEHLSPAERLRYKLKSNREYYKISVRDNGIGFEKSYAEKIFQIFQRLHGKSEYTGSGIGLAICRKIADNHKGLIFAESEPGEGSIFTIILPNKP
jgi:PAS domain S-box-containing protein